MTLDEMLKDKTTFRFLRKKDSVPGKCGVYFLFLNDELVRIGKSVQMRTRLRMYSDSGEIAYTKIGWANSKRTEYRELEGYLLDRFKPKRNVNAEHFNPVLAATLLPVTLWVAESKEFTIPVQCPKGLCGATINPNYIYKEHEQYEDWMKFIIAREQVRRPDKTAEYIRQRYEEHAREFREAYGD